MNDLPDFYTWATEERGGLLVTEKGGAGSGRYPKGSGEGDAGGGPSGSGGRVDPAQALKAEEAALFQEWSGQSRSPKEGVTRPQIEKYYEKKRIIEGAERMRYSDGKSAKQTIDGAIASGYTKSVKKGPSLWIENATHESMPLKTKVEKDYYLLAME